MNAYGATPHVADGCILCGVCVALCTQGALAMGRESAELAHPELCDGCCACEDVCPQGAIACEFAIEWDEQTNAVPAAAENGA